MKLLSKALFIAILCALISGSATASSNTQSIDVTYGISIAVDGKLKTLTDVNGNAVYPFVYQGTTYVPIRGVSQLLGANVWYDAENVVAHILSDEFTNSNDDSSKQSDKIISEDSLDAFELFIRMEQLVDEYDYVDHNINGVLYKYILDENDAKSFLNDLQDHIDSISTSDMIPLRFDLPILTDVVSQGLYDDTRKAFDCLDSAFSDLGHALDELEKYLYNEWEIEFVNENHYDMFLNYIEDARESIQLCNELCESNINAFIAFMNEHTF